ncbi:MAG: MotA/TolQ/ExbB proton channel family protein [Luteolibacter sp.]
MYVLSPDVGPLLVTSRLRLSKERPTHELEIRPAAVNSLQRRPMYEPPQAPALPLPSDLRKPRFAKAGVIAGIILMLSPIVGAIGMARGMSKAFDALGSSGIGDPQVLSGHIGEVLISTVVGFALFPFGLILFVVGLLQLRKFKRRAASLSGNGA